jgi:hypothetical protein
MREKKIERGVSENFLYVILLDNKIFSSYETVYLSLELNFQVKVVLQGNIYCTVLQY